MKTLKSKEDEVLDDFVNRATNAAELQQEIIKNQIKYYLYGWFDGIIPYCTKSRITEIINKVYEQLLTLPKNLLILVSIKSQKHLKLLDVLEN
mgnify:CR=1 FL=1